MLPALFVLPWIFRAKWKHEITWLEMGATTLISIGLVVFIYIMGIYNQTHDVEIINGEVISKNRIHDQYIESYDCNCSKNSDGSTSCDTCYEDHYTVEWVCNTNIGNIRVKKVDETDDDVYDLPDPVQYTKIQIGDPVAQPHTYVNYVKAVPDSLFHQNLTNTYDKLIPPYPENVYDLYRINRILTPGVVLPDQDEWNQDLSNILKVLGPRKQANIVFVFVNTSDQSYLHSLEGKWIGGNKNDIIIIIGVTQYPKIDWVGVSSWTDSQLFKIELRDSIMSLGAIDRDKIIKLTLDHTMKSFVRKQMKDFEYLQAQIHPPLWVMILAFIVGILSIAGFSYYFYLHDPFRRI